MSVEVITTKLEERLKKPCHTCPFAREGGGRGYTGGSAPERFAAQALGPFHLPCHHTYNEKREIADQRPDETQQCAGAAIYRANIGVADKLPETLLRLPADRQTVFSNAAELIAYHRNMSVSTVWSMLHSRIIDLAGLLANELLRARNLFLMKRHGKETDVTKD